MSGLQRPRGDTWLIDVGTIKRRGTKLTAGQLAGAQMWFTVKSDPTAADPGDVQVTEVSSASGVITIDTATATAVIRVNSSATALAVGTYAYDVQLLESDGTKSTLDKGTLTVWQDVTLS